MTTSSITGWIGCLAAGIGSVFFFATNPHEGKPRGGRPTMLHAAVSPGDSHMRPALMPRQPMSAEQMLRLKVELLERGRDDLLQRPGYIARFTKQEVVHGELLDEQTMLMKCRHEPFSVYLAWETGDVGREVLYVEGEHNDKLLAHDGGWKSRLPAIWLKPDSSLALRDARYPVTDAGLAGLMNIMLATHRQDLEEANFASCTLQTRNGPNGRRCQEFTTRYKSAAASPMYRKSITCLDEEWNVPLETHHFEWPRDGVTGTEAAVDAATLIESYRFEDVEFRDRWQADDFDRANAHYYFQ